MPAQLGNSELVKEFTLPMRCFPATLAILKEVVQECEAYLFLYKKKKILKTMAQHAHILLLKMDFT